MVQRAGTEPANGNSPLPSPKQPQVRGDPGPDSLALSVNHLWDGADLIGIQLPFDEVTFDEDMAASAAWAVRHRKSHRTQRRVHGQILTEMTERLQPLQHPLKKRTTLHQRRLVDINVVMNATIMFCSGWQGSLMPTKPLQIHVLVSITAATWVIDCQEKEPPMTISKNEHLRLDAAAVVADLLWSWRLFIVVGTRCTWSMTTDAIAQAQAYALPQGQLDAWHSGGLVLTRTWSRSSVPQCQNNGAIGTVEDSLQYMNIGQFCKH